MKKLLLVAFFLLLGATTAMAQNSTSLDLEQKLVKYSQELNLDASQQVTFSKIIREYDALVSQFNVEDSGDVNAFNRLMKTEISAVYHLLNREQFKKFKALRAAIEPEKQFKTN